MIVQTIDSILVVKEVSELSAVNASAAKAEIISEISDNITGIDFDCSKIDFIDSSGLGVFVSLQKRLAGKSGQLRLLNPKPTVLQLLELTRLHRVFEIVL